MHATFLMFDRPMPHPIAHTARIDRVTDANDVRACLAIRHTVFVEEQGVPVELEIDDHDHGDAAHFAITVDGEIVGTARLCLFGMVAKIQRVAVLKAARGQGRGAALIQYLAAHARENTPDKRIALDAQTHAITFYERLGFKTVGTPFDDAGIPHIRMELPL